MAISFIGGNIQIGPTELYPFTSFRFTTAGVSGSNGPLGTALLAAYTGSTSGSYFSNSQYFTTGSLQGYQIWTVPQTATYEIEVAGAASGLNNYPSLTAGRYTSGAIIKGRIELIKGQKFVMVVGQRSLNATTAATGFNGIGGGGGSFFVLSGSNVPYLIAGGGGGMGAYSNDPLGGAVLRSGSLAGNGSTSTTGSLSFRNAPGGTGGLGGRSHINTASVVSTNGYDGGAGAGFLGNGMRGDGTTTMTALANHGAGGYSFLSGSIGGLAASSFAAAQATQGGFGGGGGGSPIAGGGGGGYSGGGGSYANNTPVSDGGGGGGSYIISNISVISTSDGNYDGLSTFSGSVVTNLNSYNSGSGYIQITKL